LMQTPANIAVGMPDGHVQLDVRQANL